MARKQTRPVRRGAEHHPTGDVLTVDDAWKFEVRAEMSRRGWDQKTLASKIDSSEGAVTKLLKPGVSQSRIARKVHDLFKWPAIDETLGVRAFLDSKLDAFIKAWPELTDEQRAAILTLARSSAPKNSSGS